MVTSELPVIRKDSTGDSLPGMPVHAICGYLGQERCTSLSIVSNGLPVTQSTIPVQKDPAPT